MSCTPLVTSMRAGGRRRTARQPTADDARISRQFSVWPRVLVDRLRRTLSTVGSPRQFARPGGVASAGFWPASLRPCRNGRLLHFVHLRHDSLRGPERRQDRHCRLPSGRGPIRRRYGRSVAGLRPAGSSAVAGQCLPPHDRGRIMRDDPANRCGSTLAGCGHVSLRGRSTTSSATNQTLQVG